jgi:23S rRNA maturation-related 3'-5' exoribonuclease YhaM
MYEDGQAIERMRVRAQSLGDDVFRVCQPILDGMAGFGSFQYCSGSSKPHQHHFGTGGLANHVCEVIELCLYTQTFYEVEYDIDKKELFLAAFFHDIGKIHDYKVCAEGETDLSTEHKRMIHHISRSGIIWSELAKRDPAIYAQYFEKVLHAILAHHTMRSAGSPVAPKSRVAWIVTLCDNMSARMYDADTLDIVKHYG